MHGQFQRGLGRRSLRFQRSQIDKLIHVTGSRSVIRQGRLALGFEKAQDAFPFHRSRFRAGDDLRAVTAPDAEGRWQTRGDHSLAFLETPVDQREQARRGRHGPGMGKSPDDRGAEEPDHQSRRRGQPGRLAGALQPELRRKSRVETAHDVIFEGIERRDLTGACLRIAVAEPLLDPEPARFTCLHCAGQTGQMNLCRELSAKDFIRTQSLQPPGSGIVIGRLFPIPGGKQFGESGMDRFGGINIHRKSGRKVRRCPDPETCNCEGPRGRGIGPGKGRLC